MQMDVHNFFKVLAETTKELSFPDTRPKICGFNI